MTLHNMPTLVRKHSDEKSIVLVGKLSYSESVGGKPLLYDETNQALFCVLVNVHVRTSQLKQITL
jgi:hypothetical protein